MILYQTTHFFRLQFKLKHQPETSSRTRSCLDGAYASSMTGLRLHQCHQHRSTPCGVAMRPPVLCAQICRASWNASATRKYTSITHHQLHRAVTLKTLLFCTNDEEGRESFPCPLRPTFHVVQGEGPMICPAKVSRATRCCSNHCFNCNCQLNCSGDASSTN